MTPLAGSKIDMAMRTVLETGTNTGVGSRFGPSALYMPIGVV